MKRSDMKYMAGFVSSALVCALLGGCTAQTQKVPMTEIQTEAPTEAQTFAPLTEGLLTLSARVLRGEMSESTSEEETDISDEELLSEQISETGENVLLSDSELQTEGVTQIGSELQTEGVTQIGSELQNEDVTQIGSELQTEGIIQSENELQTEIDMQSDSEFQNETQTQSQRESQTDEEAQSEPEQLTDPEIQSESELSTESEMQSDSVTSVKTVRAQDEDRIQGISWQSDISERLSPAVDREMVQMYADNVASVSPLSLLEYALRLQIAQYDGTWSVYVKDLTTGESLLIHDQPMRSASIMKLFILGAVYEQISEGTLERSSELVELMSSMIRASSNSAANRLIERLGSGDFIKGVQVVNDYIESQGYSEATKLYNGFEDDSLHPDPEHENQTSAADVGDLLGRIYTRSFARRAVCNEVEDWLLGQGTRYKIPKALPDGVLCGNKTGETETIENDCAVIYTTKGDYLLCVMSSDWENKTLAQERITDISAEVYRYFADMDTYVDRILK